MFQSSLQLGDAISLRTVCSKVWSASKVGKEGAFIEHLLCTDLPFLLFDHPLKQVLLLSPFFRCRNWGIERPGNCPKVARYHEVSHLCALVLGFSALHCWLFGWDNPLLWGDCPMHCRVSNSIPGLYLLFMASNSTPRVKIKVKNVSSHCRMSPGGQNQPQLRTTACCSPLLGRLCPLVNLLNSYSCVRIWLRGWLLWGCPDPLGWK